MNNQANPETLREIATKASELHDLLRSLGTMPSYSNPSPEGLPELPWSRTTLGNLSYGLACVASLLKRPDEDEAE